MKERYKFCSTRGFKSKGVDPNKVALELDILRRSGPVTPGRIVSAARNRRAELHKSFEWDDTKAAAEHRLSQARALVRAIVIVREEREDVRMYYHITTEEGEGEYVPRQVLIRDASKFDVAKEELLIELRSAERSVREIETIVDERGPDRPRNQRVRMTGDLIRRAVASAKNL